MSEIADQFELALKEHASEFDVELGEPVIAGLRKYYGILQSWNARLHLVAPCSPEEFAIRHVLESLLAIKYIPANATIVDIGSGGGLPIIPCMIARQDIRAALFESSPKKAVFLREALKLTNLSERATVLASRFEDAPVPDASVVTCRALERFSAQLPFIVEWSPLGSTLILFGGPSLHSEIENTNLAFQAKRIPESDQRFVFVVGKK
jgi:16S rRNA (guanine527-N7)-methyltransferase